MILIDANIYLYLFGTSDGSITKLIPTLAELGDNLFITNQIVSEVNRNKLDIVSKKFNDYLNAYKFQNFTLPKHLDSESSELISDWNRENDIINKSIKSHKDKFVELIKITLNKIQNNQDKTSILLSSIFDKARKPDNEILARARIRKELGIPPGKFNDPLGDQISWEQFLDASSGKKQFWILTNDHDYLSNTGNVCLLNPVLLDELKAKAGDDIEVFAFNSLVTGLKHYSENRPHPLVSLPDPTTIQQIQIDESLARKHEWGEAGWPDPKVCHVCGAKDTLRNCIPRPSRFGGWTYQWHCSACGSWCDFGEPYDD